MSDSDTERSNTTEQPKETSDASSRSERPELGNSTSDMKSDATDSALTGADSGSGTHQSERPELGTNQPDATKPERAGESSGHTPEGPPAPDRQSSTPGAPNTGDMHPGIEGTGPYPGDSGPGSSTTYPDTGIDAGSSSAGPQQTPGAENPTDKATTPTPEVSSDGSIHQGERPELGTPSDATAGGPLEPGSESAQEPAAKPEGGGGGDVTVGAAEAPTDTAARSVEESASQAAEAGARAGHEGDRWDGRADDSKAKGGNEKKTTTIEGHPVTTWTTPDGHKHNEADTTDGAGNKTGSWHNEHWTDKKGDHQHYEAKDKDGNVTSTIDRRDWKSPDGHTHHESTTKNSDGTTSSSRETWKTPDGKEHYKESKTDANGTTSTEGTRWKGPDGKLHESSVTTGPITVSPTPSGGKK
ncbi:hypothetical protein ACIF8W_25245 [Streptomyces sp. NPDC085639]|uniref:hypothetical protein n=1 Tax=Streptomyces sp. NPDC085639 TaxID=3365734 RepID=UPI0037CEDFB1